MITLYAFGPRFGLPEASSFVTKTEVQLKMAGLAYRKDFTGFEAAPKGKLPYIEDDGEWIADSTFIRAHVERKYGVDLDRGLDAVARAGAWAVERMIEDHLGWASTHARWVIRSSFDKGPAHFFDDAPEAVRAALREEAYAGVVEAVNAHGIGRHSDDEILDLATRSLSALSVLLGDKPFLMGGQATGVDATAFAFLAGILTPFFDHGLRRRAEGFPNLVAYTGRMMQAYYPEVD